MNIRSLLLGSAAALVAVSGAQAADAIVAAEPEPLEYVRICDAFGAGYFFIPGTETCLKVGGKVRTEGYWKDPRNAASNIGTQWHTRAELSFDTATDTEYGPLKTNTVYRWDWQDGGTTNARLLFANISLGGFTVGKLDSQYTMYMGYTTSLINDEVVYEGPKELNQLTYKYDSGNGFTALVSLEDSNSSATSSSYRGAWQTGKADHYAPDVVAGAGYKGSMFQFRIVGGYDSVVEEGAIKARIDGDFGAFKPFFMGGWNTDGDKLNKYAGSFLNTNAAACPKNGADCGWGDWAFWTGFSYTFTPKLQNTTMVAYTDSGILQATTNLAWRPVKDLVVTPELTYMRYDAANTDQWTGALRFERKF
ncbi:porin [Rhizobium rhizogenes]|uniref:porin n=1 Tax=Rhizobium rhizogenes TaxID=359 RepID=UPI0004D65F8C|nr:porin [Rhizobium rhizogenes]KEA04207.1 porin [Rhizobium rhizogenes]MQB31731.1 porin [Rhizobium rhizogenes]NTI82532.1 porin [Rhizobium rhizogenes]NTJ24714.1 porin [Rhizobium rhizogenes]QUE79732.1 porin [Rhizobium rhizogenes]